jgi:hypothetical protein
MDSRGFDQFARRLATGVNRRILIRGGVAAAAAAALGLGAVDESEASRIPSNCTRFILAAGSKKTDKFRHIDDDLQVWVIPKGRKKKSKLVFKDDSQGPNGPHGRHIQPIKFKAKVGDQLEIIGINAVAGGCELDEMYLFCDSGGGGGKGEKLMDHYECNSSEGGKTGVFFDKKFRIR